MDISEWLCGLGLESHVEAFAENAIDAEALVLLSDEDLKELGVTALGHRRKLLAAIAELTTRPVGEIDAPASAVTSSQIQEGERRQVTVLFADISGFTQLSSQADPEEVHALLNRFFGIVDNIVQSFGGAVDKHIGDCVMAVFGAPVAHSNDPERAVRAALEVHQAVGDSKPPIRVHIGIASGQVVASGVGSEAHQEYTITGDSVNLASRLQDMAGAGETYISHAVHQTLGAQIRCDAVGEVGVDGFEQPVRVWRLQAEQPGARDVARHALIGRSSELRQFGSLVEHCREMGRGQSVHLRGEAGIGKTHLAEEFEAIASREGFACHVGQAFDFGVGKGQDAIRAVIRSLLDLPFTNSDESLRRDAIDRVLAKGLLDSERRVYLNDLLDLPQPNDLKTVYDAMDNVNRNRGKQEVLADLVRGISAETPLLIMIEDLHWADDLVLAHAARLAEVVLNCAAILVLTSRIESDPLDQAWKAVAGGGSILTMDLGLLRDEEALLLAGEFFEANDHFVRSCIERAGGNPLFLELLLRSAEERSKQEVPGSVQSIVLARMDNLESLDRHALQAASVVGQRFSLDLLRNLIDSSQYTCSALVEHYLVRPQGEDYQFAHALVREGVYSSLLKTRRRELHRRAADWYADRDLTLRAEHLGRAEDEEAANAFGDAGESEARHYRFEKALKLMRRGQEIATEPAALHRLIMLEGEYLREMGRPADSITVYRRALAAADDDVARCRAWIGLSAGMRVTDDYEEALEILTQAETVARTHALDEELSDVHYYRGNLYFPLGNIDGCLTEQQSALEAAQRAASPEREARALSGLGDAYYSQGRMITALNYFRRCIELSHEHGFGRIAIGNQYMVAWNRIYLTEMIGAREDAIAAVEAAKRVGHQRAEMVARLTAGRVLVELGELGEAERHIEKGVDLAELLGANRFKPFLMIHLARSRFIQQGPQHDITEMMQQALAISRETGIGFLGPWVLGTLALVANDAEESWAALAEGEQLLAGDCVGHNHYAFYPNAMEVAIRYGDWDALERFASALDAYSRSEPLPWSDFFVARGRTLASYGRGNRDGATMQELGRLREEAERVGLKLYLPSLETALAVTS
jgi:class 3 adenylate cyclase/tetratricopeptide (TPR) repeat protein